MPCIVRKADGGWKIKGVKGTSPTKEKAFERLKKIREEAKK